MKKYELFHQIDDKITNLIGDGQIKDPQTPHRHKIFVAILPGWWCINPFGATVGLVSSNESE